MVSIIKLVNGAEIIGEVIFNDDMKVTLKDPLQINYRYKNDFTPPTISLQRYSPFAKPEELIFKQEHILNVTPPVANMIKYYQVSLKNIKENVDGDVDQELAAASGNDDLSPESQAKLALIERQVTKATLN